MNDFLHNLSRNNDPLDIEIITKYPYGTILIIKYKECLFWRFIDENSKVYKYNWLSKICYYILNKFCKN